MEKIIEVNSNFLFSGEHLLLVEDKGLIKANEIKTGDKIIGIAGESTLVNKIEK
jgi:hypothetical protein